MNLHPTLRQCGTSSVVGGCHLPFCKYVHVAVIWRETKFVLAGAKAMIPHL